MWYLGYTKIISTRFGDVKFGSKLLARPGVRCITPMSPAGAHEASSLHTAHEPGPNSKISRPVEGKVPEDRRNRDESTIIMISMMQKKWQRHRNKYQTMYIFTITVPSCFSLWWWLSIFFFLFPSYRRFIYCVFPLYFPFNVYISRLASTEPLSRGGNSTYCIIMV